MQTVRSRRGAYVAAVVLQAVLPLATIETGLAQDDTSLPDKIYNGITAPFRREATPDKSIEYRERSPLVIPPTTELPPPQASSAPPPAWPKDAPKSSKRAAAKGGASGG